MVENNFEQGILTEAATLTIALEPTTLLGTIVEQPSRIAHMLPTISRSPQQEDFNALSKLFFDRRSDMTPGYSRYPTQPSALEYRESEGRWAQIQEIAQAHPDQYFAQEAVIDGAVSGYLVAEAPPDDEFIWCNGIAVDRKYQGRGVASFLADGMLHWAYHVGRPIRARIAEGNQRSNSLFGSLGFSLVETEAPTPERPIPFNIMELRLPRPNQNLH